MEDDTLDWYRSTGTRWPTAPLRSSCELVNGFPFPSASFKDSGVIPLVRVRDIRGSTFKTYLDHHPDPRFVIENGNLVIGMDGDFNCIRWVRGAAALNQRICLLKSADTTRLRFIAYALPRALKHLNDLMPAATVKHLSSSEILKTHIPVPGVEEIGLIVRYLDHAELRIAKAIAAKQQVLELLRERRQSNVQATVLKGLAPDIDRADTGVAWLGSVPAHWRVVRARECFVERVEKSMEGAEELLSVSQYFGVRPTRQVRKPDSQMLSRAATLVGYKVVLADDLVVNTMLAWNGSLGASPIDGIVSPAYAVYRPLEGVDTKYFQYLLTTPLLKGVIRAWSSGIQDSRLRLYPNKFFQIAVPLPSFEEQKEISLYLDAQLKSSDEAALAIMSEIALLKEYRMRLISDVVTGKLDVREEASKLPEIDPMELATIAVGENGDDEEATDGN